ncbi:MAG: hypothetical protein IT445_04380 [Phycisphaeraceae bacterium]|nr:hypothetical protein [Phycisphaeraceae bacterium]
MNRVRIVSCLLCALLMAGWCDIAWAAAASASNDVTWRFDADDLAGMTGSWSLEAHARATCSHPIVPVDDDVDSGNWVVGGGLAQQAVNAAAASGHAAAGANATVSANIPAPLGGSNQLQLTVSHTIGGASNADPCPISQAHAKRWGKSLADIDGATITGSHLQASIGNVTINRHKHGEAGAIYYIYDGYVLDPVQLTLTEIETGVTYVETIWDVNITYSGQQAASDWTFSSTEGVKLQVGRDGDGQIASSVSITGSADSSWLLDPYGEFSATLGAGGFSATGAWAALPWVMTYDGADVVSVSLDASYVPDSFDYAVPDALINPAYNYDQGVNVANEEECEVVAIPEPAALCLLVPGLLVLGLPRADCPREWTTRFEC